MENVDETNLKLPPTAAAKDMKEKTKWECLQKLRTNWKVKPFHGQYPLRANNANADKIKHIRNSVTWE